MKLLILVRFRNSLSSPKYSSTNLIVCSSPNLWARWARRLEFRKSQYWDNMKKSSSMLETRIRRVAWLWRNSPHWSFNDTGSCRRHFRTLLRETPPALKALRTQSTRSSNFSSNCFISSSKLSGWTCAPSSWFVGGWEGNHLALGDSCCELSTTLLGGVRGVGGVSGEASSREMSWPNREKLKDTKIAWPPGPRLEAMVNN